MKDYKVKVCLKTNTVFEVKAKNNDAAIEMVVDLLKKVNFIDRNIFSNELCLEINVENDKCINNKYNTKIY